MRAKNLLGSNKLQVIVLVPTRELALQVSNEFNNLKHYDKEYRLITVYGGVPIED